MAKQRVIPNGFTVLIDRTSDLGVIIYSGTYNNHANCAIGFKGRKAKSEFYLTFGTNEKMMEYCNKFVSDIEIKINNELKGKTIALEMAKVGDVLRSSWGHEQTNVDYYQVVAKKGSSVTIRAIDKQKNSDDGGWTGTCVPLVGKFIGPEMTKRIQSTYFHHDGYCVKLTSYSTAFLEQPTEIAAGLPVYHPRRWTAYA